MPGTNTIRCFPSLFRLCVLVAVTLLLGACSAPPKKTASAFWPAAPSYPRVQFLMGINSSADVEPKETGISLFAVMGATAMPKPILKPYGMAEHKGVLYVCDVSAGRVLVMDIPGQRFEYLKGAEGVGRLKKPVGVAVDPEGFIYVADSDRKEVVVFNPDGSFANAFGRELNMKPVSVAVDEEALYVLDITSQRVYVLNRRTGAKESEFGRSEGPDKGLHIPISMGLDDKGFIYVTNMGHGKTMIFDRDGHYVRSFGQVGTTVGMSARPRGIAVDHEGQIYQVDGGHQTVQLFNPEGHLLMNLSGINEPVGALNLPAGVLVSETNLDYFQKLADPDFILERVLYVTCQYGGKANMISVFGLGKDRRLDYDKEYENIKAERVKQAEQIRKEQQEKEEREKKAREKQEQEQKGQPTGGAPLPGGVK